jgi:hypothetical protein
MIDQLNQVLGELNRLHADADRLIDQYIELICKRDGLNIPIPAVRLYQIDGRETRPATDSCRPRRYQICTSQ